MRVQQELKKLEGEGKGQKGNMIMSKCWNIIQTMAENEEFVPKYLTSIER